MDDKLTLAEIRQGVRNKLDDQEFPAATIDEAANDFQAELFTSYRIRFMETSATLTTSQGDTTLDFPRDMLTLLEMVVIERPGHYYGIKEDYMSYEEFMRFHADFQIATPQRPKEWTEFGGGLRFASPVNGNYDILTDYIRIPELMESDNDEAEVRKVWKEMFVQGTLVRIMEINEDYAEANQERDKLDPMITTFITKEGRGQIKTGPLVIGTKRGRTKSYRADRDF